MFSRSGGHKTKETYPTRPGSPTPCKQGLKVPIMQAEGVRTSESVSSSNIAVVDMLRALHVSVAKLAQFSRTESLVKRYFSVNGN